jgi:hypothetical protein
MLPNAIKAGLDRLLRAWFPAPRTEPLSLDEALPWLLPKVRPRFNWESLRLRTDRPVSEFRPLADIFALSLVVDHPDGVLEVQAADLERWHTDFDRLLQKARTNLLARGAEEGFLRMGPGRFRSTWRDSLDGSRLLLPGVLRRLELDGDPVVVLPNRDTLLVVGSEDAPALGWALAGALEFLEADPGALNGCPLRLRHYQWEPFLLGEGHPARNLLGRLQRRRLRDEYARQKALLDQRHGLAGRPITVAPFQLERTAEGQAASYTIWSPDQGDAWLPEADRLCLAWEAEGRRQRAWIPWETVRGCLGPLLEPVGLFPERHRFKERPGNELIRSLVG